MRVDHCQGLVVGVKIICSSMGRGYIVTVNGWRTGGEGECCKFVKCIHGCSLGSIPSTAFVCSRFRLSEICVEDCMLFIYKEMGGGKLSIVVLHFTEYWYFTVVVS